MTTGATLNGLRCVRVRLLAPWRGAWVADCDLDPDDASTAPTAGPATLVIAGATLLGTIDPRGSGAFAGTARARVVAGGGAWDTQLARQAFHSDNGLQSTLVYGATAGAIGEKVTDNAPRVLGVDFVRAAGNASAVFAGRRWRVDFNGVTQVDEAQAPIAPDASLEVLSFEPLQKRVDVACDVPIVPGTTLSGDARFHGATLVVRDVEQTFGPDGSRAVLWCADAALSRLGAALKAMARDATAIAHARSYRYRVVSVGPDGRVNLQAVRASAGMPDMGPISVTAGSAGHKSTPAAGATCYVVFTEGDPAGPRVDAWDTGTPVKEVLDASSEVDVGPSATLVALAGGANFVALSNLVTAELTKISATLASLSGATFGTPYVQGAVAAAKTKAT